MTHISTDASTPPAPESTSSETASAHAPAAQPTEARDLTDPSLYLNRELSLVQFHKRVLAQATDTNVPLLERIRFLTIVSSILDEFYEVRVAGLMQGLALDVANTGPDHAPRGSPPADQRRSPRGGRPPIRAAQPGTPTGARSRRHPSAPAPAPHRSPAWVDGRVLSRAAGGTHPRARPLASVPERRTRG